jgi:hypothetical protein
MLLGKDEIKQKGSGDTIETVSNSHQCEKVTEIVFPARKTWYSHKNEKLE